MRSEYTLIVTAFVWTLFVQSAHAKANTRELCSLSLSVNLSILDHDPILTPTFVIPSSPSTTLNYLELYRCLPFTSLHPVPSHNAETNNMSTEPNHSAPSSFSNDEQSDQQLVDQLASLVKQRSQILSLTNQLHHRDFRGIVETLRKRLQVIADLRDYQLVNLHASFQAECQQAWNEFEASKKHLRDDMLKIAVDRRKRLESLRASRKLCVLFLFPIASLLVLQHTVLTPRLLFCIVLYAFLNCVLCDFRFVVMCDNDSHFEKEETSSHERPCSEATSAGCIAYFPQLARGTRHVENCCHTG